MVDVCLKSYFNFSLPMKDWVRYSGFNKIVTLTWKCIWSLKVVGPSCMGSFCYWYWVFVTEGHETSLESTNSDWTQALDSLPLYTRFFIKENYLLWIFLERKSTTESLLVDEVVLRLTEEGSETDGLRETSPTPNVYSMKKTLRYQCLQLRLRDPLLIFPIHQP